MEKMVRLPSQTLRGRALAWAVADALGFEPLLMRGGDFDKLVVIAHFKRSPTGGLGNFGPFDPTTDWNRAGPMLGKHGVFVGPNDESEDSSRASMAWSTNRATSYGHDYLEAAMRHLVSIRASDLVEVPEILVEEVAYDFENPRLPCGLPAPKPLAHA